MLVFEFKAYGKQNQFNAVDEAIRTAQFIRNSCLRYWMDNNKVGRYDLNKYCAVQARNFPFAEELNSMARHRALNEHGLLSPDFMRTARKEFLVKKVIHSFRKTVALLSTKPVDGSLRTIENQSILSIKKGLEG